MSEKVEYKKMSMSTEQLNANLSSCNTHRNNKLIHITDDERAKWNAKASAAEVQELVQGKATQKELDSHTGDSDIHISASERKAWDAKASAADVQAVRETADGASQSAEDILTTLSKMSRTVTATTESEVREALQFAAEHPGCYLNLTLAAGLNATIPTLYIRNATIMIAGTKLGDALSNEITFELTSTTSNLHLQNTSLLMRNVGLNGNHNHSTGGYGVVRAEYGSSVTCENVVFDQADGSLNFGNNIEIRDASRAYIVNTTFQSLSTAANACGVYVTSNGEAVAKNCGFSSDSTIERIGRLESGATLNQIGTEFGVYRAAGHASVYRIDGVEQA